MQGTDYLLRSLVADGVGTLFMVPGGLVDPFLPALDRVREIRPIVACHEGGAAYMADGFARATGAFGACLCIGGPGLGNTVTALMAAQSDSSRVLLLSGEVATAMEGLGAFQDASAGTVDDASMVRNVTRWSYTVPTPRLLHHSYERALKTMYDGASGPVHLSLPKDVQTGEVAVEPRGEPSELLHQQPLDFEAAERVLDLLRGATRIAFLVGNGIDRDDAEDALEALATRWEIPVATTLEAKGALPEDHPLSLGVFGYAGTRHATAALLQGEGPPAAEVLLILGSGMNERDSMHWSARLAPSKGYAEVNLTNAAMGHLSQPGMPVKGHPGMFLRWLMTRGAGILDGTKEARREWLQALRASGPRLYDEETRSSDAVPLHPARVIAACRKVLPRNAVALCDSGAHRAFAGHYWSSYGPRTFLSAAALGPMGWAIPAGVGAAAARPDRRHVVFTGDGCMRMHGLEIATAARYRLPVGFVVLNNAALGNVWLRAHTLGQVPDEVTTLPDHDWAAVARALGLQAATVRHPDEIEPALQGFAEGPWLVDAKCDRAFETPIEPWRTAVAAWSYHE